MANSIQYADLFQKNLDKVMTQQLTSGWMEANAGLVKYDGGATVKIPKMTAPKMGDYDRTTSTYPAGAVGFSYETHELTMDRGIKVTLDSMDVNETNFVLTASSVLGELQRVEVAPEIDAYRYSTIYGLAADAGKVNTGYQADVSTIYKTLLGDIAAVRDAIGQEEDLVITMSTLVAAVLANSTEATKYIAWGDFKKGEVNTRVKFVDGVPIIEASSGRMKTAFDFFDGTNDGKGGFGAAAGSKNVNWIITPKKAPIGVVKTSKPKIIAPDANQDGDAYIIALRKYHDLWIPDNKLAGVFVNIDTDGTVPSF